MKLEYLVSYGKQNVIIHVENRDEILKLSYKKFDERNVILPPIDEVILWQYSNLFEMYVESVVGNSVQNQAIDKRMGLYQYIINKRTQENNNNIPKDLL